jgi:hypothetical protein
VSRRLHPEISRGIWENERNPFYGRQTLGLIIRRKAELENLLINTCPEEELERGPLRTMEGGEHQSPPCSLNVAPTTLIHGKSPFFGWILWVNKIIAEFLRLAFVSIRPSLKGQCLFESYPHGVESGEILA